MKKELFTPSYTIHSAHTHAHKRSHTYTAICKWFYCLFCFFFLPPAFFHVCIGIIMEPCCVISVNFFCYCQQQFFPNFPHHTPHAITVRDNSPFLAVLTFVGIILHIVAAGVFCFVYFSLALLLCFYYIICSI